MIRRPTLLLAIAAFAIAVGRPTPLCAEGPQAPAPTQPAAQADEDDDAVLHPAEPDFVVINIPTSMRLPRLKGNFRLTHRFAGNLRSGTFGQKASNLFGIDQGAIIGFEYRFAPIRGVQAGAYRSSFDRTIQLYGIASVLRQGDKMPVSVSALASIEGTNNFQEKFAPAVGAVIGWTVADRLALYATPIWVNNTAASLDQIAHGHGDGDVDGPTAPHVHRSTTYIGLGARIRPLETVYLVGEITPRLSGYAPDEVEYGFGIEKRAGGHIFSLTFTNTFATTFAQLARGGTPVTLYLGFNLARKFF